MADNLERRQHLAGVLQPGGLPEISRRSRSAATTPPVTGRKNLPHPGGVPERRFAVVKLRHAGGAQLWHPSSVHFVFNSVPGVSLALNPRLMSGSPPGCSVSGSTNLLVHTPAPPPAMLRRPGRPCFRKSSPRPRRAGGPWLLPARRDARCCPRPLRRS